MGVAKLSRFFNSAGSDWEAYSDIGLCYSQDKEGVFESILRD